MSELSGIGLDGKGMLWIDFYRYAAALFGRGSVPWFDQAEFAAFYGKAQALLRSDVTILSLEPLAGAWIAQESSVRDVMRSKRRPGFPLRSLLQDAGLRTHIQQAIQPLRLSHPRQPLVLTLPSPRRWLSCAYRAAYGEDLDAAVAGDADEIDEASMFVADFLRTFGESGIAAVLLIESPAGAPATEEELALYGPLVNQARHYRWQIGLLDPAPAAPLSMIPGLDFWVAPSLSKDMRGGVLIADEFWAGGDPPPVAEGHFRYATLAENLKPEIVIRQLAKLRGGDPRP